MRVPIAWLREYVELLDDSQTIADRLAMLGFPVEHIEERPQITGVVVGRIVELDKHPNADRLQVGKIDVGTGSLLTIATAATNVAAGQTIPVALIGAKLPHITIERRKMRGLESEGMMVSAEELALPPEWFEDGIMQLDADLPLGTDVVEHFRLSDDVLDVEITSNRVDAMSMIGLARELAAAGGAPLRLPSFDNPGTALDAPGVAPRVTIASADCTRFVTQRFDGLRVGPAPAWMRIRLALAGQRPINNVVDISNYVMLETGQPLHFYDDAGVRDRHLIVRDARDGEKLTTLDDVTHTLTPLALVIADEDGALGLAGLKGGKTSEVSPSTTSILLESANFNGARIRRMSAKLGFRTDASSRHEKSPAASLTSIGAARAATLLTAIGAHAYAPHDFGEPLEPAAPIHFPLRDIRRLLGFDQSADRTRRHLESLGFGVTPLDGDAFSVVPPPWRRDVKHRADVVEEVARMAGYENVPTVIPTIAPHEIDGGEYHLEQRVAASLASLGYNEIITYSMVGADSFAKLRLGNVDRQTEAIEIRNPLSEDQRYLRIMLLPSFLAHIARVDRPLRIFEIAHVFTHANDYIDETQQVTFALAVEPGEEHAWHDPHFLRLKGDCEVLIRELTGRTPETVQDSRPVLHPGKMAAMMLDNQEIAVFGRVDPRIEHAYDLRLRVYVGRMLFNRIPPYIAPRYNPPSKFPSTYRDLALLVDLDITAAQVEQTVATAIGEFCVGVRVFDEYRGPGIDADSKSIAVRATLQRYDATITDDETDDLIARAIAALHNDLGARIRA